MEKQCDMPHPGLLSPIDWYSDKPDPVLSFVTVCSEEPHLQLSRDSGCTHRPPVLSTLLSLPLALNHHATFPVGLCLFGGQLGKRFSSQL